MLLLAMVPALPPAGRLVVLAPLAGGLVVLWRFRDAVHPRVLPVPLTVVAALYGLGLLVALVPADLGARLWHEVAGTDPGRPSGVTVH